jgi:hypothetical protein
MRPHDALSVLEYHCCDDPVLPLNLTVVLLPEQIVEASGVTVPPAGFALTVKEVVAAAEVPFTVTVQE